MKQFDYIYENLELTFEMKDANVWMLACPNVMEIEFARERFGGVFECLGTLLARGYKPCSCYGKYEMAAGIPAWLAKHQEKCR